MVDAHPTFGHLSPPKTGALVRVRDRVRSLIPKRLYVLAGHCRGQKRLLAAVNVLKVAGLHGLPSPTGATDPEEIEAEHKEKRFDLLMRRGFG